MKSAAIRICFGSSFFIFNRLIGMIIYGCLTGCLLAQVNIGADHRVLDGATVAKFCNEWKQLIEKPELLVLHLR